MMTLTRRGFTPIDKAPGVYHDVPFDEYLSWNAMSKSLTDDALKSASHLRAKIDNFQCSDAMNLGSIVDAMLLDPGELDNFVTPPDTYTNEKGDEKPWNNRASVCKLWNSHQAGKTIVKPELMERANALKAAVISHPTAGPAVLLGKKQVSIVWNCPHTGILCKGRFDILADNYIWDLKCTIDASSEAFGRQMANMNWYVQSGIYSEAWEILTGDKLDFRFIAAETGGDTDTPMVAVYETQWDSDENMTGRLKFKRACQAVDSYSDESITGYSEFAEPIAMPKWAMFQEWAHHDEDEVPR